MVSGLAAGSSVAVAAAGRFIGVCFVLVAPVLLFALGVDLAFAFDFGFFAFVSLGVGSSEFSPSASSWSSSSFCGVSGVTFFVGAFGVGRDLVAEALLEAGRFNGFAGTS